MQILIDYFEKFLPLTAQEKALFERVQLKKVKGREMILQALFFYGKQFVNFRVS
jgi:hypothetical protein